MSLFKRGKVWWYEFWFAGRRIQESTKATSKSVAKLAEVKRRRELEEGFNSVEDVRHLQIQTLQHVSADYLTSYGLRHKSATFAKYAVGHVVRLLGERMVVDIDERSVTEYQDTRLREKAAPKSVNEEVGFLLRLLGDRGTIIRNRLKKEKTLKLKVPKSKAKAYSAEEKRKLVDAANDARSPHIRLCIVIAQNTGMRAGEIRHLRWMDINFDNLYLTVGRSKTAAGEGRTIPINPDLQNALLERREWFVARFGSILPDWYLFPGGRSNQLDPTRPVTTLKTAWTNLRKRAGVKGRLHDARHTFITELAESGVGDQTIMDLAGHVTPQMVKHYSHIRMQTKRDAVQQIWLKQQNASTESQATEQPQRGHRKEPDALDRRTVRRHPARQDDDL
jgi:integrase